MLGTCSSKDIKDVIFRIEASALRKGTNGTAHRFICDLDEAKSYFIDIQS